MTGRIVQITCGLGTSRKEYEEANRPYAKPIADVPGLRWKVWTINETTKEAGGVYHFIDAGAAQAFLDGPIIAGLKGTPGLSIKSFDVIEPLTRVTRGPIR